MMNMMNNGSGWWMGGFMGLFAILFWALVIVGIVLVVRWLMARSHPAQPGESALGILEKRYALGEIDRETFERMRRDIDTGKS